MGVLSSNTGSLAPRNLALARLNLVILNEMFVTLFGPLHMSEVRMNDAQYHYPNLIQRSQRSACAKQKSLS
jgi:hypothetical protein